MLVRRGRYCNLGADAQSQASHRQRKLLERPTYLLKFNNRVAGIDLKDCLWTTFSNCTFKPCSADVSNKFQPLIKSSFTIHFNKYHHIKGIVWKRRKNASSSNMYTFLQTCESRSFHGHHHLPQTLSELQTIYAMTLMQFCTHPADGDGANAWTGG